MGLWEWWRRFKERLQDGRQWTEPAGLRRPDSLMAPAQMSEAPADGIPEPSVPRQTEDFQAPDRVHLDGWIGIALPETKRTGW